MMKKKYGGVIVPTITPLLKDGTIDEQAVAGLFRRFYNNEISPFVLGTTGETASLSLHQKEQYLRIAAKYKQPGTMLYAGIGSNVAEESETLARMAASYQADAVAATLPNYYILTPRQMEDYFLHLANVSPLPVIVYNIPATTHMSIPLAVVDALSHHPNIIALKDSERSDERMNEALALWKNRDDFAYFIGWAARSAAVITGGGDGLIPSTGNLYPEIYSLMLKAATTGDMATVHRMQQLSDVYGDLYQGGKTLGESLWALKYLMSLDHHCHPYVMPPLQPLDAETAALLSEKYYSIKREYTI